MSGVVDVPLWVKAESSVEETPQSKTTMNRVGRLIFDGLPFPFSFMQDSVLAGIHKRIQSPWPSVDELMCRSRLLGGRHAKRTNMLKSIINSKHGLLAFSIDISFTRETDLGLGIGREGRMLLGE